MKAVVAAFNQEKALVGAFSVIMNLRMELFQALVAAWRYCLETWAQLSEGGTRHQPRPRHHHQPAASTAKQNIIFSLNIAHEETMHMYRDCTGLAGISLKISRKDKTFLIFVKSHN